MASSRDEGPVYYREIQKNAYLKRIPNEVTTSILRPLGHKVSYGDSATASLLKRLLSEPPKIELVQKPPLKAMWTQLCVHNGRTPYLEQYPEAEHPAARAHRPAWRACLRGARHVTASVKPHAGQEYDFLVDTEHGPVRMLAPDWESMQDWVNTLRNKLHELKIVSLCENVYVPPPLPPAPRAAARDPTSPLPPTPPVPPDRVPGIEIAPVRLPAEAPAPVEIADPSTEPPQPDVTPPTDHVDISNWETPFSSLPSTSQNITEGRSVAKICGQNICLDDSMFKRTNNETDSDEEFFAEIDRLHASVENLNFRSDNYTDYKQTVVVNDAGKARSSSSVAENASERPTNITVIQVSNKEPPHTAIPVLRSEADVFDFDFNKSATNSTQDPNFVNIVNTEVNVNNSNEYGTVFSKNESEYGHLSLTTTVNLTGDVKVTDVTATVVKNDGFYERLCMACGSAAKTMIETTCLNDNEENAASTSNQATASPLSVRRLRSQEKMRKSSLPNLDTASDSTYEYLFPNRNNNSSNSTNITLNGVTVSDAIEMNSNNANSRGLHINSVAISNTDSNSRVLRSSVERSQSQNTYDITARQRESSVRRVQNNSPNRDGKSEKAEPLQSKPIWKRGLTDLSLLTRLRSIGQTKRQDSPTRQEAESNERNGVASPGKVVRRSRPEARIDSARRRSSSLSNGAGQSPALQPLRARQAAALQADQRRGAAQVAAVPLRDPPIFVDYKKTVWVAWWGYGGVRCGGRSGDSVCGVRAVLPRSAAHAAQLLHRARSHHVDILFHRVPLGKIYVLNKRDQESIGIKLDSECNITSVENDSPASRVGIPPPGKWAVTEVNNRPINILKGGEEEMNRLSLNGTEVSVLIQPSALVKKLRSAIKGSKPLFSLK